MSAVFADTFYFLAMLNPRDADHSRVTELNRTFHKPIVTTQWVLVEVGDALASILARPVFVRFLRDLHADARATVVPASSSLFASGVALFESRADKEWSLTDCISFEVMERRGIVEALTADHHFEQAGFVALLK